jgi:hypothetical protein
MKTEIALLSILAFLTLTFNPKTATASEWEFFGKKVEVGQKIVATVPVGESITSSPWTSVSLESINADSSLVLRLIGSNSNTAISATVASGSGSVLRPCVSRTYTAIKIKVLSVDFENGVARLEVSQFWPYPNEVKIDSAK